MALPSFQSSGNNDDDKYPTHVNYTWEGLDNKKLKTIKVHNEVENGRHSLEFDATSNRVSASQNSMPFDLLIHLTNELVTAYKAVNNQ